MATAKRLSGIIFTIQGYGHIASAKKDGFLKSEHSGLGIHILKAITNYALGELNIEDDGDEASINDGHTHLEEVSVNLGGGGRGKRLESTRMGSCKEFVMGRYSRGVYSLFVSAWGLGGPWLLSFGRGFGVFFSFWACRIFCYGWQR